MKHLFTFLFVLGLTTLSAQNTWIVSNTPGFDADFTDLQTAINTAAAGDILLIQGSAASYGNATITKPLVLSGPGYFLNQNPQTQAQMGEATLGVLTIDNGGSGCIIEGLTFVGGNCSGLIILDSVSNVIIQSCRMENVGQCYYCCWGPSDIYGIAANFSQNIVIKNCYLNILNTAGYGNVGRDIIGWGNGSNFIVSNNILLGCSAMAISNSIIENNIMEISGAIDACTFQNNILTTGNGMGNTNSYLVNNLSAGTPFGGNINGNQENVDMSTVFVGYPTQGGYSADARWQLKPNSPAIGAGVGGIDCGAWGGSAPYKLSGMSFNPNIWQVVMPVNGTSGGGLNVTVKANANQ